MTRFKMHHVLSSLTLIVAVLTACSQESAPTDTPIVEPTATTADTGAPAEPEVEIQEVVKMVVIPSEVVVENFIVQRRDESSQEIEIVVQGFLRNTCTVIEEVSLTRDGDLLLVGIKTAVNALEDCQEAEIQFQEVVSQDIGDMEPGTYLIANGPVERLEIQVEEAATEAGTTATEGEQAETGEDSDTGAATDTTTDAETAAATPTETEPRECEDYATFLGDVTYPDNTIVLAGETFTKTWEIRNDGDCTWGPGYGFTGVSGLFSEVVPVEDPFPIVEPSETVQLSLVLTAPLTPGEASGAWVIERPEGDNIQIQNGENFDLWAIVNVAADSAAFTVEEARVRKDGVVCAEANVDYDNELLILINAVRAENGLPAYTVNDQLTAAARTLTSDMACNEFVDHTGSDGSSWYDRISAEGYLYEDAAENIYFGFAGVPEIAFNLWMDSSVPSGNILSSSLTEIGIAYALNPQTGGSYYTLVFAVPEAEE